mmetsp:Transcript_72012/g.120457  ORF Transcript_72012/g.120457 Transcript_72012/m.120457 type:complete len:201 (+) Transcript_72012:354-956(+)
MGSMLATLIRPCFAESCPSLVVRNQTPNWLVVILAPRQGIQCQNHELFNKLGGQRQSLRGQESSEARESLLHSSIRWCQSQSSSKENMELRELAFLAHNGTPKLPGIQEFQVGSKNDLYLLKLGTNSLPCQLGKAPFPMLKDGLQVCFPMAGQVVILRPFIDIQPSQFVQNLTVKQPFLNFVHQGSSDFLQGFKHSPSLG